MLHRFVLGAALAGALVVPTAALAQGAPPAAPAVHASAGARHHHRHGAAWRRALKGIQLSDAQRSQLKVIVPQARRAAAQRLRAQIDGVLTPDQRTQFHANLAAMRAHRARHRRQDQPPAAN